VTRFGFNTRNFPRNTQLAIGGGTMAVTPLEMVRAYAVFANGGYLVDPNILQYIKDPKGNEIYRANHPQVCPACEDGVTDSDDATEVSDLQTPRSIPYLLTGNGSELPGPVAALPPAMTNQPAQEVVPAPRAIDERNAFIMNSMLREVISRGTGFRARELNREDLAGKTGTTNDAADTWFNGFNRDLATTVWIGFSNHEPLGAREYGATTPLPVWMDFMRTALAGTEPKLPPQPPGIVSMKIDPTTGDPAGPGQSDAIFEYFLREHAPQSNQSQNNRPVQNGEEIKAIDLF
jgi:penicillin-binding protein 1A